MNANIISRSINLFTIVAGLSIALLTQASDAYGQNVGINANNAVPDASAMLDVVSTSKGLLIPRVALIATNAAAPVTSPATSLVVYNTATAGTAPNNVWTGFYYWDGTKWVRIQDVNDGTDWHVIGNGGTTTANFLGTTDGVPLNFRVNNQKAGRIGVAADGSAFLGYQAGNADDLSNNKNTFVGYQSGAATTTGFTNSGIGYQSLNKNTTGSSNTSAGYQSLFSNTTGYQNTADGYQALYSNTTGYQNSAAGYQTLYNNIGGYGNSASGYQALYNNTSGNLNSAYGYLTLYSNTTGSYNTGIGAAALYNNNTGQHNIAIGDSALYNTTNDSSIAIGTRALFSNTTGFGNIAVGTNTMYSNTTGSRNLVLGHNTLYSNVSNNYNTAVGNYALYNCTSDDNTAYGFKSLYSTTTGKANTAVGAFSLYSNTTGYFNVAGGDSVMYSNVSGYENTALGKKALFSNTSGYYNSAMGAFALAGNTTGYENVAIGYNAGRYIADGTTANSTSNTSVYIGYGTKAKANGDVNEIVIGYNAVGLGSNTAVIGNDAITFTGLRSYVGIGTTTPTATVNIKGNTGYNQLRLETSYTPPTSATVTGNNGDIAWDATYLYVRVGSSWKRTAAFSTW